MASTLKDQSG